MDLKKITFYIIFFCIHLCPVIIYSQDVHVAIDTTNESLYRKYLFIKEYYNQDSNLKNYWHPKYKNFKKYNFSSLVDGITQRKTPKEIKNNFDIEITEIQELNDTLSYFKVALSSEKDYNIVEYKYYLVERKGRLYIDNCKDYEKYIFHKFITSNIIFYISNWYDINEEDLLNANLKFDSLYNFLSPKKTKPIVENYLCASVEEMNILNNMTYFYGYVGGFTNIEQNYIVAHYNEPFYTHEFVHVLLGSPTGNCFILGEGIASFLGGLSHNVTYKQGLEYLKSCYRNGRCTFDLLYERKIFNPRDNTPTYAFAGAFCEFLISRYGMDSFYDLYYDKEVNDRNLLEKVSEKEGIDREEIIDAIEKIIMK